jgi:hypothetical protein
MLQSVLGYLSVNLKIKTIYGFNYAIKIYLKYLPLKRSKKDKGNVRKAGHEAAYNSVPA